MLLTNSIVRISDIFGCKTAKCLRFFTKSGELFSKNVVVLQKVKEVRSFKKGQIFYSILIRTKKKNVKKDGIAFSFNSNDILLLNKNNESFIKTLNGPLVYCLNWRIKNKVSTPYLIL